MSSKITKRVIILSIIFLMSAVLALTITGLQQDNVSFASTYKLTLYFKDLDNDVRDVYIHKTTNNSYATITLSSLVSTIKSGSGSNISEVGGDVDEFRETFSIYTAIGAESYESKDNDGNTANKHYSMYTTIQFNSWTMYNDSKLYIEWRDGFGCEFKLDSDENVSVLNGTGYIDNKSELIEFRDLVNRGNS